MLLEPESVQNLQNHHVHNNCLYSFIIYNPKQTVVVHVVFLQVFDLYVSKNPTKHGAHQHCAKTKMCLACVWG
jgi:hypothetical protein